MMSDNELQRLARMIVVEQSNSTAWMKAFVKANRDLRKPAKRLVSPKVASEYLGISVRQLRRIKDKFSYVKSGDKQQSGLLFDAEKLFDEYDAYIASRKESGQVNTSGIRTDG